MSNVSNFNLKNFYNILSQQRSPLFNYQFVVEFGNLNPAWGLTDSVDAKNNISYYIQASTLPGSELTTAKASFFGTEFSVPGIRKFGQNWSVDIFLTEDLNIYKGFRAWQESLSSLRRDGGGNKKIPTTYARFSILNDTSDTKLHSFILEGIWVKKVGDISLEYKQGGGDPVKSFKIEFAYQYPYNDDGFDFSKDPLKA